MPTGLSGPRLWMLSMKFTRPSLPQYSLSTCSGSTSSSTQVSDSERLSAATPTLFCYDDIFRRRAVRVFDLYQELHRLYRVGRRRDVYRFSDLEVGGVDLSPRKRRHGAKGRQHRQADQ